MRSSSTVLLATSELNPVSPLMHAGTVSCWDRLPEQDKLFEMDGRMKGMLETVTKYSLETFRSLVENFFFFFL